MKATLATTMLLAATVLVGGCDGSSKKAAPGGATTSGAPPATTTATPDQAKPTAGQGAAAGTAAQDAGAQGSAAAAATVDAGAKAAADAGAKDAGAAKPAPAKVVEFELEEARRKQIEAALAKQLGMPVTLRDPLEADKGAVYAIYEHAQEQRCADTGEGAKRPAGCPPAEAMALNPGCRGYGLVYAKAAAADKEPEVEVSPLDTGACDLEIRAWSIATRGNQPVLEEVTLEILATYVSKREVAPPSEGKKEAQEEELRTSVTKQQLFYLWNAIPREAQSEPERMFSLDVASWTAEPWRTPEPPVLDSVIVGNPEDGHPLKIVHLLPCYDPWSERACAPEIRKREVYEISPY